MKKILIISLLLTNHLIGFSQVGLEKNKYPLTDFRQPLDITPPALAGSFGELRANHFHSGLDFRTNQQQGYPVYAVSDGYVSRLRVQNSGFGLAIYINHPNGFTSVYGHLQRFNPKLAQKVKSVQYQNASYEIDEFPSANLFPVKKGEIIGWSGNTGSSGGPHLHFEIRNTKTEITINPLLFGLQIPDYIPPVISALYAYRLNGNPFNEFTPKQYFQVKGSNGNYQLNKVNTINVYGEIGFGIITNDRHTGLSGLNGVYSITLEVDGEIVFNSTVDQFSFENSRAINSHIDYPSNQTFKANIQKSFKDPGNPMQIYNNLKNNGRILFEDLKTHTVVYTVSDFVGNKSILKFNVNSVANALIPTPISPAGLHMPFNKTNEFNSEGVKMILPEGTLYNDLNLVYKKNNNTNKRAFSSIHQIQNGLTPLHKGFDLWIEPDTSILKWKDKALIVSSTGVSQGGYYENGWVKAQPKVFGGFYVTIDTIAPTIVPINISEGKNMAGIAKMSFKISDNLSGIKSFKGYIDGQWVLMEFDTKTATLWHSFDERTSPGKHTFELIVEDMKANTKKYNITFNR